MVGVRLLWWAAVLFLAGYDCLVCLTSVCKYNLDISRTRTMTYRAGRKVYNVGINGTRLEVEKTSYRHEGNNDMLGQTIHADDVITADGVRRSVITINGQFPGPTIEVTEGAEVVVRVANGLLSDTITIHWHGLPMKDTPWMDGNPYVTQCPILPRQAFTYRFTASPSGTHWYHSHVAGLQSDGLYGLLIIHKVRPTVPYFNVAVQDWFHQESSVLVLANPYGTPTGSLGSGEDIYRGYHERGYSTDGVEVGDVAFTAALINGRGRWQTERLPLTEFNVTSGVTYRFRMVNSGAVFAFRVSLDRHPLRVVALDGYDIKPLIVDSFIISPGERVDYEVRAEQTAGRYWVRAATLRDSRDGIVQEVKAILTYDSVASQEDPTTTPRQCTSDTPCVILNCPFTTLPKELNSTCIGLDDIHSLDAGGFTQATGSDSDVVELFLNVGFNWGSSINGKKFIGPSAPFYQDDANLISCEKECTDRDKGCTCTHIARVPLNRTIQMIISNLDTQLYQAHHRMHLHGHSFAVVKIGYPTFNTSTGHFDGTNTDIVCENNICKSPRWNGTRPAMQRGDPPIKDTVTVPALGYVVVRFRSDNPGWWMFHCHVLTHKVEGMDMIIEEGADYHSLPPPSFPRCPSSNSPSDTESKIPKIPKPSAMDVSSYRSEIKDGDVVLSKPQLVGACIGCVALGVTMSAILGVIFVRCRSKQQ